MKKFVCTICGYIYEGTNPPDICPICKVSSDKFEVISEENSLFSPFIVTDKIVENDLVTSFYLKPLTKMTLPTHLAGQFISVKPILEGKYENEVRQYSLSMKPGKDFYRISIKRENNGIISNYMHDTVEVNSKILITEPLGEFILKENNKPIVLISGGIGITPILSMLYEASDKNQQVYVVQAALNSTVHSFKKEIEYLSKTHSNVTSYVFYQEPLDTDKSNSDYTHKGFISEDFIKGNLPLESDFYFCGPPGLMKHLESTLLGLGVNNEQINYELFAPEKK